MFDNFVKGLSGGGEDSNGWLTTYMIYMAKKTFPYMKPSLWEITYKLQGNTAGEQQASEETTKDARRRFILNITG